MEEEQLELVETNSGDENVPGDLVLTQDDDVDVPAASDAPEEEGEASTAAVAAAAPAIAVSASADPHVGRKQQMRRHSRTS